MGRPRKNPPAASGIGKLVNLHLAATPAAPEFKIEKGIPMPPPGGKPSRYPFADMQVGDSFFARIEEGLEPARFKQLVANRCSSYAKLHKTTRFAVRSWDEGDAKVKVAGVRVWRLPDRDD